MTVLTIIGIAIFAILLYWLTLYIDKISQKKFNNYRFFSKEAIAICVIGYYFIVAAVLFYPDLFEITSINSDNLNGIILFFIGVLILTYNIYKNVINTNFFNGVIFTAIQMFICAFIAFGFLIVIAIFVALLSETKPVYDIGGGSQNNE